MDKEFDFSTAKKPHEIPALKRLQEAHKSHVSQAQLLPNVFDEDVLNLIQSHATNQHDVQRMNNMLRILFS